MGQGPVEAMADGISTPLPTLKELGYLDMFDYVSESKLGTRSSDVKINRTIPFVFQITTPNEIHASEVKQSHRYRKMNI
jgi:hypothetical protein